MSQTRLWKYNWYINQFSTEYIGFYVKYPNFNNDIKYRFIALCGANSIDYQNLSASYIWLMGHSLTSIIGYSLLCYETINNKNTNSWEIKDILEVPLFQRFYI